jgi:hypothetical protein
MPAQEPLISGDDPLLRGTWVSIEVTYGIWAVFLASLDV